MDSLLRKDLKRSDWSSFLPGLLMICENVLLYFVRKCDLFLFYPPKLLINYIFRNHFGQHYQKIYTNPLVKYEGS